MFLLTIIQPKYSILHSHKYFPGREVFLYFKDVLGSHFDSNLCYRLHKRSHSSIHYLSKSSQWHSYQAALTQFK